MLNKLLAQHGYRCAYCLTPLRKDYFTFDHFKPKSLGGDDSESNMLPCCTVCNCKKGNKLFPSVGAVREFVGLSVDAEWPVDAFLLDEKAYWKAARRGTKGDRKAQYARWIEKNREKRRVYCREYMREYMRRKRSVLSNKTE